MSTAEPTSQLSCLVQFIVLHYLPMWMHIRQHWTCSSGACNLYRSVELLRDLPHDVQKSVRPVLQRNAFWAHPEQVLLGMVTDGDESVRRRAVQRIREARQQELANDTGKVRRFELPAVKFDASVYTEIIDWDKVTVTQPPLLRQLSEEDLVRIEQEPLSLPAYPVHTVAVEREVRAVTEASAAVLGKEARHGFVTATRKHRRELPVFNSKQDAVRAVMATQTLKM